MIIYDGQVADNYMYQDSNQAAIVVSHSTPSLPYPFTMKPNNHRTESNTPPAIDVEKFVAKLESVTSRRSKARCARSIRLALESAGADVENHPIAASDWGDTLKKSAIKKLIQLLMSHKKATFTSFIEPVITFMDILLVTQVVNGFLTLNKAVMTSIKMIALHILITD